MDCAFINGRVLTMDVNNTVAEAVAVSGRRVGIVGSNAEVKSAIGNGGKVFDLAAGLCCPVLLTHTII